MPHTVGLVPIKAQVERIQSAYSGAAKRIVDVLSTLDPATFTSADHGQALRKVQGIVLTLNDQVRMWAPAAIRAAYDESAGIARTRLEIIGAKKLPERKYNPARHDRKIALLVRTVERDFFKANLTIEKTARKFLGVMDMAARGVAKVQAEFQAFTSAEVRKMIDREVIRATAGHVPSKGISRQIMDKLLSLLGDGDFININGRNYNLKSYAELVARTRMREAQTESIKETCAEYDNDLVEIPHHESVCEDCLPHIGKVFSLSGNSDKYEKLPDGGPPWHPNDWCYMNPVSERMLEWRAA